MPIQLPSLVVMTTCAVTLACVAPPSGVRGSQPKVERPNILFAIADDWGLHAGAYGTPWVQTPNFDRIAREGMLFTNAYTPMANHASSPASRSIQRERGKRVRF